MPKYKRNYVKGGTYFFTVVTYKRQKLLQGIAVDLLRQCFKTMIEKKPFIIDAIVILPNHLHCIWQLPEDDFDYSTRWKMIKAMFTKQYFRIPVTPGTRKLEINPTDSMIKKGEKGIWQRRFWEHTIQNTNDYWKHVDYIHYNPVKHGYSKTVSGWRHSSFHKFVNDGIYSKTWYGPIDDFSGDEYIAIETNGIGNNA